jgi:hypothetical protein
MCPLTPEQLEEVEKAWADNRAFQAELNRKRRIERGELDIEFMPAQDDLPEGHPEYQAELNEFSRLLHAAGVTFSQSAIALDSIDALGYPVGQFSLALATIVVPAVTTALVAWINKRPGRKITIKSDGIEVTAEKPEDAEHAFEQAVRLRGEHLPKNLKK